MKKHFLSFLAVVAFLFSAAAFVGCSKDDDGKDTTEQKNNDGNNGNNEETLAQQDLFGDWTITKELDTFLVQITADKIIVSSTMEAPAARTYIYRNDSLLTYYNGELDLSISGEVKLLDNKNVLLITNTIVPEDEEQNPYKDVIFFYKKDAPITSDFSALRSTEWSWYLFGTTNDRVRIKFDEENHFELLVPVWGMENGWRGTYVYENGYVKMNITEVHDGTWNPVSEENQSIFNGEPNMPFFVDGDVAYGIFANLYGYFHKL